MNINAKKLRVVVLALVCAGALTFIAGWGLLKTPDWTVSDAFYQEKRAFDGQIVLVGIDQRAIEELGPYGEWGRGVMARAINYLNQSEDTRPAAIGVDVLYIGESPDPEADAQLVAAAEKYGNVCVGSAGIIEEGFTETADGNFKYDKFKLLGFEQPYEALRNAATIGHVNAMLDNDGILRHHKLVLELSDGQIVPSLALAVTEKYREFYGQPPLELPPTDGNGFWYVPFYGGPEDLWESISIVDLINGDMPQDYFAGKIVFIGPYAPGLQDQYFVSIDHAQAMYGVEFQANAVQAILNRDYKLEVADPPQLAALFAILLLAFAAFWKRKVWISTLIWLGICGAWLLLCKLLYAQGPVLHVLWVPACVTALYVGCLAANYISAVMERRKITDTFNRYVAPEIVRELLKEGDALELGGKQAEIAVLFVDVRGFTPMSEMMEPAQVVEILNRYLTLTSDSILNNQGTLDKFVGDATMAFWGAPLPQDDYVMKACRAAMDMVEGSKALSKELMDAYGRTVAFGIGVHVGPAVVGNIGSPRRMDYTAIGDTVNTAARLEANAPAGTVYISRAVADALEGRIKVTKLQETVKLKGKKEGFEILILDEIL